MQDQKAIWEQEYAREEPGEGPGEASEFAVEVSKLLGGPARVLELGCGLGDDAAHFASLGHQVLAFDLSETAVKRARTRHIDLGHSLSFEAQDISRPFDALPARSFDLVYARLSLHYFTDAVTRSIFRELHRLMVPDGILAFICRSNRDGRCGMGTQIEEYVFDYHHVRHFFSLDYTRQCLEAGFEVLSLEEVEGELYGRASAYVKAVARRP
jgi:SAM-dependent methyltransferase